MEEGLKEWALSKYVYVKLCFHRSYSHLNMPFQIVNVLVLVSIWLKMFAEINSKTLIGIIGAVLVVIVIIVGHIDLKLGILRREQELMATHHPQIQELLRRTEEKQDGRKE